MEKLTALKDDFEHALGIIVEQRRLSQDLLQDHLGSPSRASNVLCVLESNGFISKPIGGRRWTIDFKRMEKYLESPSSFGHTIILPSTLKSGGLENILKGLFLANKKFNMANILTSDLTTTEIDNNLEIINQAKHNYHNFISQNRILEARQRNINESIRNSEEKIKSLNTSILNSGTTSLFVFSLWCTGMLFTGCAVAKLCGISRGTILYCAIPVFVVIAAIIGKLISKKMLNVRQLQAEKNNLEKILQAAYSDKESINTEKNKLFHLYGWNEFADISLIHANYGRLSELENILIKMKDRLLDPQITNNDKILALENIIHQIDKKHNDEEMLMEQQKATDYAREQALYASEQAKYVAEMLTEQQKATDYAKERAEYAAQTLQEAQKVTQVTRHIDDTLAEIKQNIEKRV